MAIANLNATPVYAGSAPMFSSADFPPYSVSITTSNTTNDPGGPFTSIYVGGAGDIAVVDMYGQTSVYTNMVSCSLLPLQCIRVNVTSTTATGLIGRRHF